MSSIRSKLVTAAAVGAAALGGTAIATAATSSSSTSPFTSTAATPSGQPPGQRDPSQGGHMLNGKTETLLTGDTAAKVKAAALAKVPGTVERVETNVDTSVPYEAHITKSDGSEVIVEVSSDYSVANVGTMGAHP